LWIVKSLYSDVKEKDREYKELLGKLLPLVTEATRALTDAAEAVKDVKADAGERAKLLEEVRGARDDLSEVASLLKRAQSARRQTSTARSRQ